MELAGQCRADGWDAARRLRLACFLAGALAWLVAEVDPSLTYHGAGMTSLPAFSPDPLFLRDHLSRPGGPLAYAAAWLSQWFVFPAAGAWVLVAVAGGTALAVDAIGRDLAGKTLPGLRYLPAAVLLIADAQYLHFLDWQLGWLLCFAATALWLRLPRGRPAAGLLGLVMLYYLAGGAMLVAALVLALGDPRLGVLWPAAVLVPEPRT
ncbi:MAG: hypothetical protein HUU35_17900 [Armatimonadetes bacterium]|nr:hypothetical protein [Armatimonadota bacterium]